MSLGLPSFSMIFSGKAVSAIERSARGIVAMILTDGTEGGKDLNIYKKVDEVDFQNWTEQNYNYLPCFVRETLSLCGRILEPLGKSTSSAPFSPTHVKPPFQLLSPSAFSPTVPESPPEPVIASATEPNHPAIFPITLPIPSTSGFTIPHTVSIIDWMPGNTF